MKFDDKKVRYSISLLPEYEDIRGHMATGDDEFDRECENRIITDLESGNDWAWCVVKVTAQYNGIRGVTGTDYLGCCSYADEKDFRECGYYADMCDNACRELYEKLADIVAELV